jgi:hypothetical protein
MITTMMALWKEIDCTGMKQLTDSWTPSDDNSSHGLRLHVDELIPQTIQNIIPPNPFPQYNCTGIMIT